MDDSGLGNTVPTAGEHDGMQVAAAAVEVEVENRLEGVGVGGDGCGHEGAMVAMENGGGDGGFRERRKRGRPRKQLGEIPPEFKVVAEDSGGGPQKRGRGRPKGSGKWQTLAASFGLSGGQGGSNFTPYIIDIQAGENIVQRIWSFSQMTSCSICILSASGTISTAQISASQGRILKCEGHFTIVCLNGSHTYDEKGGGKTCLLSVQLANSDGHFYGGAVAGPLIAAGPTQIILSTFRQNLRQQARVRPPNNITAPQHSDYGTVAAQVQAENGENKEARDEGTIFTVSHPSSAEPAVAPEWNSLQPPSNF